MTTVEDNIPNDDTRNVVGNPRGNPVADSEDTGYTNTPYGEWIPDNNDMTDTDVIQESEHQNQTSHRYPIHVQYLIENYKREYWYWEIVEIFRKVLQTALVVMYGADDPLTLGVTIALSVVFIACHAYFKPMKDKFERKLQMLSLMAIFFNLLAAMILKVPYTDTSGHRQTAMAIFIIGLNLSIVLIALGKSFAFKIMMHI